MIKKLLNLIFRKHTYISSYTKATTHPLVGKFLPKQEDLSVLYEIEMVEDCENFAAYVIKLKGVSGAVLVSVGFVYNNVKDQK